MTKFRSDPFFYRVSGDYALFTDPTTKAGGEKFSYQVPTYQALKGITEAIYWKPVLQYRVESVKIMKPIRTETRGIRAPLMGGGNDLNYYTYLRDVEYLVKVYFEWNETREDLVSDRNEKKHEQIFLRSLDRGGRRDAFLGTRECIASIERIKEKDFNQAIPPFDGHISFGIQFHSFIYPGEDINREGKLKSLFTTTVMKDGTIEFPLQEECQIQHTIGDYGIRDFTMRDIVPVDDEYEEYKRMEVL